MANTCKIIFLIVVICFGLSANCQQPEASKQYARADLPCGVFVPDPNNIKRVYYFGGPSGIGLSDDGGKTFIRRSTPYRLVFLYVHPQTSRLFAIAEDMYTETNPHTGKPWTVSANKILTSEDDAISWRDISGTRGHIGHALFIFQDPDHPKRAALYAMTVRGNILQSVDDDYSDWNWFMEQQWKKPISRDSVHFPKEVCPKFERPQ
jgi:hypothetical protein